MFKRVPHLVRLAAIFWNDGHRKEWVELIHSKGCAIRVRIVIPKGRFQSPIHV